ncbi:AsmA family protein [Chitinophaga rhizophila]|uniref:AsmA family protein n=1 Tax=Chitinophaga rhizophila TaxID=2866212 RepID=A0ABS7G7K9_9BACT|nr:AsmA-like C-terminal region-containing protein [Chitinophaga rhizophila]MBW8683633.1 AsmA family protein [Chitinophaga rhizophila]
MTGKTRKKILRILLIPIAILLILAGIAAGVLYSQQQRLINLAIKELNKQLPGELVIGGSNISPFQNFPYISIGLKDVRFFATKQKTGRPMYQVERLYVGFSLPDILSQKYHVKVIFLKKGHLDLVRYNNGTLNIVEANRIKQDTVATAEAESAALDLDIKKIVLRDLEIDFTDKPSGQHIYANIDKIRTAFKADGKQIFADFTGAMVADYTTPTDTTLFRNKHFKADFTVTYDQAREFVTLSKGNLKLEDFSISLAGTADLKNGNNIDLKIKGDKPDIGQLLSFAPASVAEQVKQYKYDGRLYFDGILKGKVSGGQLPLIKLNFGCENGWLMNPQAKKRIDSLGFKGYYTNGAEHSLKTSELHLMNMSAIPEKGVFKANFVMKDFTDPKMVMQIDSDLQLEFIGAFLGIPDLQRLTGHISLKMNFNELVDMTLPEASMGKLKEGIQSELRVSDLTFRIPNYPHIIHNLNLHADMKNGYVKLDTLSFYFGNSDFAMNGSLSDLPALFHKQEKPVQVTFNARSKRMILKELLSYDTAKARKAKEEIYNFNIGLALETSVKELQHPNPLPKGKFKVEKLFASFKEYPHAFHDFGAELHVNDTALLLRNFGGMIDSSDFRFSGRVLNYQLWFDKIMKGKTQIAFDLKSQRLAMRDVLGPISRNYVSKDYHKEVASGLWLRAKADLRYDSVFKFAKIKLANVSGELKEHKIKIDSVKGTVKVGADNFLRLDTLTGRIGKTDFDVSMRLYMGKDTVKRKKENFLQFTSRNLDLDQLTNYKLTANEDEETVVAAPAATRTVVKDTAHAASFNIFKIPFIDFRATVNIGRIKYHRLWLRNVVSNVRMQTNQHLYLDTLGMGIADGQIGMRGYFNGTDPKKIFFRSRIRAFEVDLEKLMLKLDHFGQDYVINKNLKGRLNGQIRSHIQMHPDLTPILDNCEAELDVKIHDGSLVNFAPMQAMAGYFKDKNLNMVRFDTLSNKLTLKNGVLNIPNMNINSSLGFMEISGKQSLDLSMEYYMRIPMKMVTSVGFQSLFGRKREDVDVDQVDEIEYRDKDRKVRFMNIKVTGTPDNFKVGLGKAKKT